MLRKYEGNEYIDKYICPSIEKDKTILKQLLREGFCVEDLYGDGLNKSTISGNTDMITSEGCGFSKLVDLLVCENGLYGASEEDSRKIVNLMSSGYIMTLRNTDYVLQKVSKLLIMSKENTLKVLVDYGYSEEVRYMLDDYGIEEDHYVKFLEGIEKNNCCFGLKVYEKYSDVIDFLLNLEIPEEILVDLGVVA